jgi:hypothetical protein
VLEQRLGLAKPGRPEPKPQRPPRGGIRRDYFVSAPLNLRWAERAVQCLRPLGENNIYFHAEFSSTAAPADRITIGAFDAFADALHNNWTQILEWEVTTDGPEARVNLRCNLQTAFLSLNLESAPRERTNQILHQLETDLELAPAGLAVHVEDADVRELACDAPEMPPPALQL